MLNCLLVFGCLQRVSSLLVQVVTRLQQFSAMLKQLCCVCHVPWCSVSPQEGEQDLQKVNAFVLLVVTFSSEGC